MTRQQHITGITAAAALAGMAVVYNFAPARFSFYPRCPFYAATHLLCPGCGATRALYCLLHADLSAALHYNALFTLLAPLAALWCAFVCYRVMRYDRFPRVAVPRAVILAVAFVAVVFTITRNTFFAF